MADLYPISTSYSRSNFNISNILALVIDLSMVI